MKTAEAKAKPTTRNSNPSGVPFFQRKAEGNAASSAEPFFIQSKLTISPKDDPHEQQADLVADHVIAGGGRQPFFNATGSTNLTVSRSKEEEADVQAQSASTLQRSGLLEETGDGIQEKMLAQPSAEQGSGGTAPSSFESGLKSTRGGGSKLPDNVRTGMEASIGADFSSVRVHTGPQAASLSNQIGAKAFASEGDVYFNEGEYAPETTEGKHLLAHELTHTVQQGASGTTGSVSKKHKVQRSILDSLGSFFSSIRDRVIRFIEDIPGFFLFTVLLGRNPLRDTRVDRNGANFIKGFLLLLPNGQQRYDKLQQEGALDRSAAWIDAQMAELNIIREMVSGAFDRAIDSLGPSDALRPGAALERIRGYFNPVISRATSFARRVVSQVLKFLKDAILNSLVNFIKERTRAYPLLRTLLGKDPITNQVVPRTMENIVHGFLMLTESGEAYYNRMMESGALPKAIAWMRAQIATLPTLEEVVTAFTTVWRELSFEDLFQPAAAFTRIYNTLSDPVGRILSFVGSVAWQILIFIKDAMLGWLKSQANNIPGYHLLTVLLGKDVFTNQPVPRTTTNIIRGFMGLIPGGEQQFQQMQESGVIPRLANRINSAIERLGITWTFFKNLFISIWESMSITDLIVPIVAFGRIIARFREPIGRIIAFVGEVVMVIIEVILRMMNFPIDLIGQIIQNAIAAIEDIKRDPIGFLKNLLRAVKQGFMQFFGNIGTHLLNGVTGWLFGQLESAGIQPPPDLSLRSILGMMMQVMGITVDNIMERLARRIGPERVARIRSALNTLSGVWTFVKDVIERGPEAIWERIQNQISNLWNVIVEGVRNWIITRIIQSVTTKLLSMLDPTGIMAVINSFMAFFRAIQSFIEQLTRILQIINSFVQGVGEIARGSIASAANFLENALARGLPVAIAFLANQVGLRGLGGRIAEMAERGRAMVNEGIDWLIDRAISTGRAMLNSLLRGGSPEEAQQLEEQHDPEKAAQIEEGFNTVRSEETRLAVDGKISREQADQVAATVRQNHPVFTSFVVFDGEDSWNYRYTASPEQEVDTETTKAEVNYPEMSLPPFNNGIAGSFEAEFITKERVSNAPKSSNAGQNDGSLEGWEEVQQAGLTGSGENWVRMHLLTHRFMGSYLNSNLTPARSALNNPTFLAIEQDADNTVQSNPEKAIWYRVNISYQSVPIPAAISSRTVSGRTSGRYLSSLNAAWGTYDPETLSKITYPQASVPNLNITGINPPDLTGNVVHNINNIGRSLLEGLHGSFDRQFAEFVINARNAAEGFNSSSQMRTVLDNANAARRSPIPNYAGKLSALIAGEGTSYTFT